MSRCDVFEAISLTLSLTLALTLTLTLNRYADSEGMNTRTRQISEL